VIPIPTENPIPMVMSGTKFGCYVDYRARTFVFPAPITPPLRGKTKKVVCTAFHYERYIIYFTLYTLLVFPSCHNIKCDAQ